MNFFAFAPVPLRGTEGVNRRLRKNVFVFPITRPAHGGGRPANPIRPPQGDNLPDQPLRAGTVTRPYG